MQSNYHTHLKLCGHAIGMTEDYVKMAKSLSFKELGISDHAPLPRYNVSALEYKEMYMDENMTLEEFYNIYLPDVKNAKKNNPEINVLIGLETEYIKGFDLFYKELYSNLDYLILGEHFFLKEGKIIDSYKKLDKDDIIAYAKSISDGLDTKMFKILAHPDLFISSYKSFDKFAEEASRIILSACEKNDVLVEINARGMKNIDIDGEYVYPKTKFFEISKEYDIKYIIGLDCHDPLELNEELINKAKDFCDKLNIKPINY